MIAATPRTQAVATICCGMAMIAVLAVSVSQGYDLANSYSEDVEGDYFGGYLPGLTPDEVGEFNDGFRLFIRTWMPDDGLGPTTNASSCVACHRTPLPGGSGMSPDTFVPLSPNVNDGAGGHVVRQFLVDDDGSLTPLRVQATHHTLRKTSAIFGSGLLEAVPVEVLREFADPNDESGNGVSGRVVELPNGEIGRFGWKGNIPSIEHFVAIAFRSEMGMTSTMFPEKEPHPSINHSSTRDESQVDVTDEEIRLIAQYARYLAAPPRHDHSDNPRVLRGGELFREIGCADCHRPVLRTGDSDIAALHRRIFRPYTDLLVHDMGPELADGIAIDGVSEQEFRTAPLWGIASTGPPYLHDGRAGNLDEAIRWHGGEAEPTRIRYTQLSDAERSAVIEYVRSR